MSVSRFNSEGYHDPVAYEALRNVEREQRAKVKAANTGKKTGYSTTDGREGKKHEDSIWK